MAEPEHNLKRLRLAIQKSRAEAGKDPPEEDGIGCLAFLLGMAWTALTYQTHGWSWLAGGMVGLLAGMGLYFVAMFGAGMAESCGIKGGRSVMVAWPVALLLAAAGWTRMYDPDWIAAAMVAVGLAGMVPVSFAARRKRGAALAEWRLPRNVLDAVTELPDKLPPRVEAAIATALGDLGGLRGLADKELAGDQAVDARSLLRDAEATLLELLDQAPLAARLSQLAAERADDDPAKLRAEQAVERVTELAATIHEALGAAIEYLAVEGESGADALRDQVDKLRRLTAGRDELTTLLAGTEPEGGDGEAA